ncbi:MAG: FG-GAP-like repeat-containing protein, partial [Bacteroidales bacterium]
VNKDGFSDIFISGYQQVALFLGGNPMDTIPAMLYPKELFQESVSGAGDINKDGFDDFILRLQGGVGIFLGGTHLNSHPDFILKGEHRDDYFGTSFSKVGDMNQDGFDDFVVSAESYLNGNDAGRVYVYYGSAHLDTIADIVITGEHAKDRFGFKVSDAGDVNHDGYADILVGAFGYKNNTVENGRVYVYFGGNEKDTIADLLINGINGQSAGDLNKDGFDDFIIDKWIYFGSSQMDSIADGELIVNSRITGKGDYNNDGYTDIITGQPNDAKNGQGAGCVSVFYGSTQIHSIADAEFYGQPAGDYMGYSLSSAGDVNNDGYDDIVIGAFANGQIGSMAGCAYVYFGKDIIENKAALTLYGQKANDHFGQIVSSAGDINGDHFSDIIVGSFFGEYAKVYLGGMQMDNVADYTFTGGTRSHYFGSSVSKAGDFNKDGFDDIIIGDFRNYENEVRPGKAYLYFGGTSMDTTPDLTFEGEEDHNDFGQTVAYAGDVNKDGFPDIMIGAPGYDKVALTGRLYIYYGSAIPDTIPDVVITGNKHYRRLGQRIATAGDVNNDGYDDIIAGLPFYGNSMEGISYVNIYYGGAAMDTIPDVIIAKKDYGFGAAVSTAGDLNNDGFDDVIIGAYGYLSVYYGGQAMDTIPDMIIMGEENWSNFAPSISFAGDVNKDGHTDLLVGNAESSAAGSGMGRAYIYSSQLINTGVESAKNIAMNQVYPNPFSSETTIKYKLQKPGKVMVTVFNTSGQQIETLVDAFESSGEYKVIWNPKNLPGGIYFCQIQSPLGIETSKMIYQKGNGDF